MSFEGGEKERERERTERKKRDSRVVASRVTIETPALVGVEEERLAWSRRSGSKTRGKNSINGEPSPSMVEIKEKIVFLFPLSLQLTVIPDGLRIRGAARPQQPRVVGERVQLVRGAVGDVGAR